MATEESSDGGEANEPAEDEESARGDLREAAERLEQEATEVADGFDERIIDLLSWLLDTETRARIYVHLREHPGSTSEEIADGTGLYPSTVREALAELNDEGTVTRRKRESAGAGNNPYEYEAIDPSALVEDAVGQVQSQLNTVFTLDSYLDGDGDDPVGGDAPTDPVSISVETADADPADEER
ncbi:winged helix-turn-helix domain-containing protein [Halobaculum sp. CBA1158]|uniref:winged helix-turn-helix domain-containing protein n=1 Tax=Halobaculum sp. CBA1158 TaxID=2904243 RepID=UPI001F3F3F15|nr:winged helix-turn-helix domain-containing protein [Halobaculum sp. CBA1158]UIO98846.1 winged helix-turn-helix domain-containing protein [Halobaculum sp. CBA1158]